MKALIIDASILTFDVDVVQHNFCCPPPPIPPPTPYTLTIMHTVPPN